MADTIREFLIGLGFKLDEAGERRFVSMIEGATLRANLLADAIENMARVVVDKVAVVAENFEQLYYQSQRIGASANSVTAFEDAVKRLGGTAESARASLIGFGDFLRTHPNAASAIAKQLGIPLKETADHGKFLLEIGEKLNHMAPALADRFRQTFQFGDYNTITGAGREGGRQFYEDSLKRQREAGLTPEAYKAAAEFENKWRDVWDRIGTMAAGGESKLFTALTEPMQKFGKWLDENSPKINESITKMATAVGSLTIAWVDDLAKVNWGNVAKDFDNVATSISGFVNVLSDLAKDLVALKPYLEWLKPAQVHGSVTTEPIPGLKIGSGNPSSLRGLGKWWGEHAPSWLGGGGGGLSQNGAPVSESNPLAVKVVEAPGGASGGGGGFLGDGVGSAIRHIFGGGGGGSGPHGGSRGIGGWWTPDRMSHAVDRLMKEAGLTREGAAGLVARWSGVEAAGGPTSVNPRSGAAGIGQWLGSRKDTDATSGDFDRNLTHAITELNTTEKRAGDALRRARTGREGALGASMYERAEGYNGASDNFTLSTPAEKVLGILDKMKTLKAPALTKPLSWDQGHAWDNLNASLPVGGPTTNDNSKSVTVGATTNNITVNAPDPHSAAAMVGLHLDRSANDLARNLQGAHQ